MPRTNSPLFAGTATSAPLFTNTDPSEVRLTNVIYSISNLFNGSAITGLAGRHHGRRRGLQLVVLGDSFPRLEYPVCAMRGCFGQHLARCFPEPFSTRCRLD